MPQRKRAGGVRGRIGSGLYAIVVEELGQEIVDGTLPTGSLLNAEQICERFEVSRSVVREATRTLGSMGLVEARPQVGTRVLPSTCWDLLSPQVVRWRGQGNGYLDQMRELLELRLGLESTAARLAAHRLSAESAQEVLERALEMQAAYQDDDGARFFEADAAFHRLILSGTQNSVIAQLADTVGTTLDIRGHDTRPGIRDLNAEAVEKHVELARAILAREETRAQALALELVELTLGDFRRAQEQAGSPRARRVR